LQIIIIGERNFLYYALGKLSDECNGTARLPYLIRISNVNLLSQRLKGKGPIIEDIYGKIQQDCY